ncbi:MAG: hypothetical protein K0R75_3280, partial [Paenibacillaceae bacterium]|nr:hypothetical protein [Paenibacillaceae bacterium]
IIEKIDSGILFAETDRDALRFYQKMGFTAHSLGEKYPGVERFKCLYSISHSGDELMTHPFVDHVLNQMNKQLERIEICLNRLTETQVWEKLKPGTNSIGNLCVHLAGNEYQHFVSGIGGKPYIRERTNEFVQTHTKTKAELIELLRNVRNESEAILQSITDLDREVFVYYDLEDWNRMRDRQDREGANGYTRTINLHLFQVAEHYGYHSGQIVLLAKWLQDGEDPVTEYRH